MYNLHMLYSNTSEREITFKSIAVNGACSVFPSHQNVWLALKRNVSHAVMDLFSHVVIFVMRKSPTHMRGSTVCCYGGLFVDRIQIAFLVTKCWKILLKAL